MCASLRTQASGIYQLATGAPVAPPLGGGIDETTSRRSRRGLRLGLRSAQGDVSLGMDLDLLGFRLANGGLGLSNTEGGLLATVFLLGYFVTAPLFGKLGDRMSRKRLIARDT